MAAFSQVLFALEHVVEPQGFENLCVDLLCREGYSRIVPGGRTRDHGRDAEIRFWTGIRDGAPQIAFQFSMEKSWEPKLRTDVAKIISKCPTITKVVFASSQAITVEKQDKIRNQIQSQNGIGLEIFDKGWFRLRLEEQHQDLALKHLGVSVSATPGYFAEKIVWEGLNDDNCAELLRHTSPEELKATFSGRITADDSNFDAWKGLAHVEFYARNYENSLRAIGRALALTSGDKHKIWNLNGLKIAVLAEQGTAQNSRRTIINAKMLAAEFLRLDRFVDHYNYANILSALEEWEEAEFHYRKCLEMEPTYARAWSNYGSLLVKTNRTEEGLSAYDAALRLKPDLVEALCTKATVLLLSSDRGDEALKCIEMAATQNRNLAMHWRHYYYWYGLALCVQGRYIDGLVQARTGLDNFPDCQYLVRLMSDLLSKIWREDNAYLKEAEAYFVLGIRSNPNDYRSLKELASILTESGRSEQVWNYLEELWGSKEVSVQLAAVRAGIEVSSLIDSLDFVCEYRTYRKCSPLVDYAYMLERASFRPHDSIAQILYHLWLVPFAVMHKAFTSSRGKRGRNQRKTAIAVCYQQLTQVLGALGGPLLAETTPPNFDKKLDLLSRALIVLQEFALIESSRQLGYFMGSLDKSMDKDLEKVLVKIYSSDPIAIIETLLPAVHTDWGLEAYRSTAK